MWLYSIILYNCPRLSKTDQLYDTCNETYIYSCVGAELGVKLGTCLLIFLTLTFCSHIHTNHSPRTPATHDPTPSLSLSSPQPVTWSQCRRSPMQLHRDRGASGPSFFPQHTQSLTTTSTSNSLSCTCPASASFINTLYKHSRIQIT